MGTDLDERRMQWFKWERALVAKNEGGLGVTGLYSFNRDMMIRWWWRFHHYTALLWVRVIKSLYVFDGGCRSLFTNGVGTCSWNGVIHMLSQLRGVGIDIQSLCPIRIRDGRHMSFWQDIWMGEELLTTTFHRIHALDNFIHFTVSDRMSKGWDTTTLRRDLRGGVEQEQWDGLLSILQHVQLQSIPDRLGWIIDTEEANNKHLMQ